MQIIKKGKIKQIFSKLGLVLLLCVGKLLVEKKWGNF
jgi:hypothetical protein